MIKVIKEFGIFKVHTRMISISDVMTCKSSLCSISKQCNELIGFSDYLCMSIDNELKVSKLQVEYLEKVKLSLFIHSYVIDRYGRNN